MEFDVEDLTLLIVVAVADLLPVVVLRYLNKKPISCLRGVICLICEHVTNFELFLDCNSSSLEMSCCCLALNLEEAFPFPVFWRERLDEEVLLLMMLLLEGEEVVALIATDFERASSVLAVMMLLLFDCCCDEEVVSVAGVVLTTT